MINKLAQDNSIKKHIRSVLAIGTTLFITLTAGANPTSAAVEKEIAEVFKKNPDKEIVVKVENQQSEKTAKFETTKDSIKDPYDQIKWYVDVADSAYFNQLKKHMETKDSTEQMKCKAVVYAILHDTILTAEQKKVMSLALFERLARMPGSNYRFYKRNSALITTDPKYEERSQRYNAYKDYLDGVLLDKEIEELKNKWKQLDEKWKQLDKEIVTEKEKWKQLDKEAEYLTRRNNLLQQLLDGYKKTQ